jgi:tetratricopeptide (TPR) repeat protein
MKSFFTSIVLFTMVICGFPLASAQTDAPVVVVWRVTGFDIAANVQQAERALNVTATINATNIGRSPGRTLTVRLNSKASVKQATISGAAAIFRVSSETRGADLNRVEVILPSIASPNSTVSLALNYTLPVESNTGVAAISPIASQFLPLSSWYPVPNTRFSTRGADTAPFRLTVNLPNVVSSGVEKTAPAGSSVYEQPLNGEPFLVQGDWDRLEGTGEGKGITAFVVKGASAEEKKQAETLIAYLGAGRTYYATAFGPAPDVPLRLVSVRRGAGFSSAGTILVDEAAFRRPKLDAATALSIAEALVRLWIGSQTPIHGEGGGVLRDGLVRYIALSLLEKQFGKDAAQAELLRSRLAYTAVAKRDGPLAVATELDSAYFGSIPNRGAMFWRLVDHSLGHAAFTGVLKGLLQSAKDDPNGLTLAAVRAALVERGGDSMKQLLAQQLDQVIDMDLLIGLPQQRGAEWFSALRNLGSTDVSVTVAATTDRGEQVLAQANVPARGFGEAVFKTAARIVRVEVDPDKLYPQIDYSNDSLPRTRDLTEALADVSLQLGAQDYVKAEAIAREILAAAPRLIEGRVFLGRALLGQNKLDEAEKAFRAVLDEVLPTTAAMAWANLGLGEIGLKRGQAAEAAKRFNDAVRAAGDYPSSVAARASRIKAEAAANSAPPIDEAARAFIGQLSQAVMTGKKIELESRIVSGELVRFINGIVGTQPEIWETTVLRTEQVEPNLLAADVGVHAKQLGQERSGTAVFLLSRTANGLKLSGIELFELR